MTLSYRTYVDAPSGGVRADADADVTVPAVTAGRGGAARTPRLRRFRPPRAIRRLSGPVLLLGLWAVLSGTGQISKDVLPTPWSVFSAGWSLAVTGELWFHLSASLVRVGMGLLFGLLVGITLAVAAGLSRLGEDLIDWTVQLFKSVPHIALLPLLIMWFGINQQPRLILIATGVGISIYINTFSAIRGVEADLVEAATSFGATRFTLVTKVILPGALPGFLVGLRFAVASAWLSLIFAEMINTNRGLGFLMSQAQTLLQTDIMMFTIVIYAVIGLISYGFVKLLEHRLLQWRKGYTGA